MTAGSIIRPTVRPLIRGISEGKGGGGGVPIAILSSSANGQPNNVTPITIDVPVGTTDGMELLLYVFVREDLDLILVPGAFSEITALSIASISGDDRRGEVFQRTASSEPASYEVFYNQATGRQMVVIMLAIANLDAGVFDVTPAVAHRTTGDNNNNPDTITITTLTEGAVVLNGICTTGAPTIAVGEPSGNTLIASDTQTAFMGAVSSVAPPIGAVAAIPWNNTAANATNESVTNVIALKPAA